MNENIGKVVRIARKYRGLTLSDLDEKMGIQYSRFDKFEYDYVKEISTKEIVKLLEKVLDFELEQFYVVSDKIDCLFSEFLDSLFYDKQNFDTFKEKINEGRKIAPINYSYGKAKLIEYIILVLEGEIEKARLMENGLFEDFENEHEVEAILFQYKGLSYSFEKHYKESLIWFEKAELQMHDKKNKAMLMIQSGFAYRKIGDGVMGMNCVDMARKIFTAYGSFRQSTYCFIQSGLLLKANDEYDKAIACFNIALRIMRVISSSSDDIAKVYRNMCWTMIDAQDYEAALKYLKEAKSYVPKHNRTVLYEIWCHYKLKEYNEAKKIIMNNKHLVKNVEYADIYKLLDLLVKCEEGVPSNKIIKLATKIGDSMKDNEDYERVNSYLDIVLELLSQSGDEIKKIKYLKMMINLKTGSFVSIQDGLQNSGICDLI